MTDQSDYVVALEDECARANAFIGVLRLVASRSEQPVYGDIDYPMYQQYVESRDRRFDVLESVVVESSMTNTDPLPIRQGGLMRCCIGTWRNLAPAAVDTLEGASLVCEHCESSMIVVDGMWEWKPS